MGLIAGNSLEPFLPKCNKEKDWTISSQVFVDSKKGSTTKAEIMLVGQARKAPLYLGR